MDIQPYLQLGLAGVILVLILWPVMKWMMSRNDEKDKQLRDMIAKYEELHSQTLLTLKELPNQIVKGITEMYNPKIYEKGEQAYKKILKKEKE